MPQTSLSTDFSFFPLRHDPLTGRQFREPQYGSVCSRLHVHDHIQFHNLVLWREYSSLS